MSVMVIEPKIFEYVLNGLVKTAHNKTCDQFYAYKTCKYFESKDIFEEAQRLVISWAYLNELSFNVAYNEEGITNHEEINLTAIWYPEAMQLLKYLEAISYNIEIETIESKESFRKGPVENAPDLPEKAKADYALLNAWIIELITAIIHETEEYKKALYNDPAPEQPLNIGYN